MEKNKTSKEIFAVIEEEKVSNKLTNCAELLTLFGGIISILLIIIGLTSLLSNGLYGILLYGIILLISSIVSGYIFKAFAVITEAASIIVLEHQSKDDETVSEEARAEETSKENAE